MSLEKIKKIAAEECFNCFQKELAPNIRPLPFIERINSIDDLYTYSREFNSSSREINRLVHLWHQIKNCAHMDEVLNLLLAKQLSLYQEELAPTTLCYHDHLLAEIITTILTRALGEADLTPEEDLKIGQGLLNNQDYLDKKPSFDYTLDTLERGPHNSLSGTLCVQTTQDVTVFMPRSNVHIGLLERSANLNMLEAWARTLEHAAEAKKASQVAAPARTVNAMPFSPKQIQERLVNAQPASKNKQNAPKSAACLAESKTEESSPVIGCSTLWKQFKDKISCPPSKESKRPGAALHPSKAPF